MAGTASFPVPGNQTTVPGGRDDDIRSSVGSKVSAAKFVDNTIHHAIYKRNSDTTGQYMAISRPTSTDFQVTSERSYDIIEEESSIILKHSSADGVEDDIPPFFSDIQLTTDTTPPLFLLSGEGGKMIPDSVTTVGKGSRLDFRNLQGRTPSQVSHSFTTGNTVHAGQIVDVGMRTSDLVMRLFNGKNHSLNSISVSRPFAGPRTEEVTTYKGGSLARHSHRFLSKNFISTTIPDAVRFIGRHDNYHIFFDRFGNFIYAPDGFSNVDKQIDPLISSNIEKDSVVDVANSVTVKGKVVADNDNNRVTVNDVEMQKRDGVVKSMRMFDPAATTLTASRRSANQMLRLNRKAQGVIKSKRHQMAWDLYPSDIIEYRSPIDGGVSRKAVLEVEHDLDIMSSNFQLLSYENGIERVLVDHSSELRDEEPVVPNDKIKALDMGGGDRALFRVRSRMYTRNISGILARINSEPYTLSNTGNDIHSGFLIGHRNYDTGDGAGRSAIGTGLTPRLTGGSHSTGTITVSSTTGFPSAGHLVINEAIHAQYTGTTSTTFTGVTVQAPSGASIPGSGLSIRLFRSRGHEVRTVKGITSGRVL
tara:strand:+ start:3832 stop:5601 length:1770 start_codon:yes stop_codon:yes gene_type:complete